MAIKRVMTEAEQAAEQEKSANPKLPGGEEDVRSAALGRLKDQLTAQVAPPKVEDPLFKLKKYKMLGIPYPLATAMADKNQAPPESVK